MKTFESLYSSMHFSCICELYLAGPAYATVREQQPEAEWFGSLFPPCGS